MRCNTVAPAFLVLAALLLSGGDRATAEPAKPLDVVELFTSQSCSACPPADSLLGRLAREDGILALSYSVDYWDYLDWKDTLADPAFSARQKGYAKSRGDRAVYTPQMVINGMVDAIGSDQSKVRAGLTKTRSRHMGQQVSVEISGSGPSLVVKASPAPTGMRVKPSTLWLVVYADTETVSIRRGENEGRTVTYHNVVRRLESLGTWRGEAMTVTVAMPETEGRRCAVLLQEGTESKPGRILAADRL